ncbi:unnamed protein product, partial [Prunus brigantina]
MTKDIIDPPFVPRSIQSWFQSSVPIIPTSLRLNVGHWFGFFGFGFFPSNKLNLPFVFFNCNRWNLPSFGDSHLASPLIVVPLFFMARKEYRSLKYWSDLLKFRHEIKAKDETSALAEGTQIVEIFSNSGEKTSEKPIKFIDDFDPIKAFQLLPTQLMERSQEEPSNNKVDIYYMQRKLQEVIAMLDVECSKNKDLLT